MDDSNQEECENERDNSSIIDEFRRNRCRLQGNSDATGVYIDLLRRSSYIRAAEEAAISEAGQSSLADSSPSNINRLECLYISYQIYL